jgi:uncharacterized protein
MRSPTHRPGLSFEVAPPQRSHPNRTDIACFVGCAARRRAPRRERPLPEVLARWIESQPAFRTARRDFKRLRGASVALDSLATFRASLAGVLGQPAWPDVVDEAALVRLLEECRELTPVPASLVEALAAAGFTPGSLLGRAGSNDELARSGAELEGWTRIQRLLNLPVRCDSFEAFAELFDWEHREVWVEEGRDRPLLITPLGAALRAFFGSGARTAHVVVTGAVPPLFANARERYAVIADQEPAAASFDLLRRVPVLPGAPRNLPITTASASPVGSEAAEWRGIEHVFGLPDVSFLVLPDLVDALAADVPQIVPRAEVLATPELFADCVERPAPALLPLGRRLPPPRLGLAELGAWRALLGFARELLDNAPRSFHRRDVQLIASLPLAADEPGLPRQNDWAGWLASDDKLNSDRIQLGWPWLRTRESDASQGGVEAPEGSLAGALAASALRVGSFESAARFPLPRLVDIHPRIDLGQALSEAAMTPFGDFTLGDRVCLLAPTVRGPELVTDVTLAADPLLRAGAVRRLVNVVIAQARFIGEDLVFEANGETLWSRIVDRLNDLGRVLIAAGAVSSDAGRNAFVVRCGRTTMTQTDIDAGRTIVEIEIVPAQPIARIVVVLDLRDSSRAEVRPTSSSAEAA